jgi:hypothetical protein
MVAPKQKRFKSKTSTNPAKKVVIDFKITTNYAITHTNATNIHSNTLEVIICVSLLSLNCVEAYIYIYIKGVY